MDYHSEHVMTLANSIIGVSVLAMPYCFKECGIVLSIFMLIISSIISRLACHFLLKSAIMARRRTFEFLAFHAFGALGKFIIEIGMIGFLIGTCIAFFVVMGDLGPEIISEITGVKTTNTMRTSVLMALALFCVLPLGLLRNIDSLNGVSKATVGFYCCLVLKIVAESAPYFFAGEWLHNAELWRPAGILQCIPIFSMALFCQTQLFEIYQAVPNASLEKMNEIIRTAVNICTCVYIFVGMFGYIAFYKQTFTGNILLSFRPSIMTDVMKMGFVLSVAFSFPLVIFPCRASLYSLIYKRAYSIHEGATSNYIPEGKFKTLTFAIVFVSLVIGVLIPNIELVLGLVGSTIGVMICVLFPVTCFICMSPKNTNERILAQMILFVGVLVMVLGTYANLYAIEEMHLLPTERLELAIPKELNIGPKHPIEKEVIQQLSSLEPQNSPNVQKVHETKPEQSNVNKVLENKELEKEIRHEPPQPVEPVENGGKAEPNIEIKDKGPSQNEPPKEQLKPDKETNKEKQGPVVEPVFPESDDQHNKKSGEAPNVETEIQNKKPEDAKPAKEIKVQEESQDQNKKLEEVNIEAIKKEETELREQEKENQKEKDDGKLHLIDTLEKQNEVHQQLIEEQKKLIQVIKEQQQAIENGKQQSDIEKVQKEKLEAVKQIESIAKKAIESLSGKDNENAPTEVEKLPAEDAKAPRQDDKKEINAKDSLKEKEVKKLDEPNDIIKKDDKSSSEKNAVNMIPLPIAVSNNLTIYGQPRKAQIPPEDQQKLENAAASKDVIHKEAEVNINQVDNMNINIKHEINLNVDSNPKTLIDLLKGDQLVKNTNNTENDKKETVNKENPELSKTNKEADKENIQAVRREILSSGQKLFREKRSAETDDKIKSKSVTSRFKISSNSPLIHMVTKLSNSEFAGLSNINLKDVNGILKPIARDLGNVKIAAI